MNRNAVDTVWLQATDALCPMRISGTPYSDAPVTLILPGMVSCDWKNRSVPSHGKCGLPSSRPRWSLVPAEPIATALLPMLRRWARSAAASACPVLAVAAALAGAAAVPAFGGAASLMPWITAPLLDSSMSW